MAKEPKQRYVLNLKLHTESFQEDILEKRFGNKESKYSWISIRLLVTMMLYFIAYFVPNFSTFLNLIGIF